MRRVDDLGPGVVDRAALELQGGRRLLGLDRRLPREDGEPPDLLDPGEMRADHVVDVSLDFRDPPRVAVGALADDIVIGRPAPRCCSLSAIWAARVLRR